MPTSASEEAALALAVMLESGYCRVRLGCLGVLSIVLLLACHRREKETGASPPAPAWASEVAFIAEDASKTDAEYVALGLTQPDTNWTSEDMRVAGERLRVLASKSPGELPRYRSSRSGRTFARLTSPGNLEVLSNPAAPVGLRFSAALAYTHALNGIYELYAEALQKKIVTGDDLAELHGARLHACQVLVDLAAAYLPTLATTDPSRDAKMNGVAAMRRAVTEAMISALRALTDPQRYGASARKRLLEYCRAVIPQVAPRLSKDERDDLVLELKAAAERSGPREPQPDLQRLLHEVLRSFTETTEPP